jgi:hypothetical protein
MIKKLWIKFQIVCLQFARLVLSIFDDRSKPKQ